MSHRASDADVWQSLPQSRQRIDSGRAPRRNDAGGHRASDRNCDDGAERDRIPGGHAVEKTRDLPRDRVRGGDAGNAPATASSRPSLRTSQRTPPGRAPSAIRMLSSW